MDHHVHEIDRAQWLYWLHGNGAWMDRLACSGGDWLAMLATILPCLIMFGLYVVYALQTHAAFKLVLENHFRQHLEDLRNVFILCGTIHVVSSVVCWFIPLYYVVSCMLILNCWLTAHLVKSKSAILAIQSHTRGLAAEEQLENVRRVIHEEQHRGINASLDRLEDMIGGSDKGNGN